MTETTYPKTETTSYSDNGSVEAETIITTEDTEFVVVETKDKETHRVFEREHGKSEPDRELTNSN